jgi:hypothetical protein
MPLPPAVTIATFSPAIWKLHLSAESMQPLPAALLVLAFLALAA